MNKELSSLDASSRRWLIVFAMAAVVTIVVLARSFFIAFAPPKEAVNELQQSPPVRAVRASSKPVWDAGQQNHWTGYPENIPPTPPSKRYATAPVAPTNWGDAAHVQAEYLRKLVRKNGNRDGANAVTEADIAKWEKEGRLIQ